jgi:hypothetical protein
MWEPCPWLGSSREMTTSSLFDMSGGGEAGRGLGMESQLHNQVARGGMTNLEIQEDCMPATGWQFSEIIYHLRLDDDYPALCVAGKDWVLKE